VVLLSGAAISAEPVAKADTITISKCGNTYNSSGTYILDRNLDCTSDEGVEFISGAD
jgi:hypothetical protein